MPRKRRTQPGTSGGNYANRTDLTQPVRVGTGAPYGQRQELETAQQQAPLPQQAPPGQIQDPALVAALGHNFAPAPLNAPTDRPYEPITHGLPIGPGAGPEVMQQAGGTTAQRMRQLANSTGDTTLADVATRLEQYGL